MGHEAYTRDKSDPPFGFFNPRNDPGAHMMISIAAGVLLVRSMQKSKVNHE